MGLLDRLLGRKGAVPAASVAHWTGFATPAEYRRFLDLVCAHLTGEGFELTVGDGVVEARRDGGTVRCGLQNLAQKCAMTAEREWPATIREHFKALLTMSGQAHAFESLANDAARARELVKLRLYPEGYAGVSDKLVHRALAPGVIVALAYDLPDTVSGVPPEHLAGWGIDVQEAFEIGLDNLARESLAKWQMLRAGAGFQFHVLSGDSFFTSSQVLRLGEIFHLGGPHGLLVGVPHRHTLIVYPIVDAGVAVALPTLAQIAAGLYAKGPGSLSPNVYWWRAGKLLHVPVTIDAKQIAVTPPPEFTALLNELAAGRPA